MLDVAEYSKLSFYSGLDIERVAIKSHANFSVGASISSTTVTIPHNLGYRPYFRVFIKFPNSSKIYRMQVGPSTYDLDGVGYQVETIDVNTTNLYVTITNYTGSAGSGTVYYRVYAERFN